jgi:hypothetical protein
MERNTNVGIVPVIFAGLHEPTPTCSEHFAQSPCSGIPMGDEEGAAPGGSIFEGELR